MSRAPSKNNARHERDYKRPESVLVVVHTRDGLVLLLKRKQPAHFWQSVSGGLEWGEQPAAAAARELREETGFTEAVINCNTVNRFMIYPMWRDRYAPGVVENVEHVFRLECDTARDVALDEREHEEYRWLLRDEALALASSHTDVAAIKRWVSQD